MLYSVQNLFLNVHQLNRMNCKIATTKITAHSQCNNCSTKWDKKYTRYNDYILTRLHCEQIIGAKHFNTMTMFQDRFTVEFQWTCTYIYFNLFRKDLVKNTYFEPLRSSVVAGLLDVCWDFFGQLTVIPSHTATSGFSLQHGQMSSLPDIVTKQM